MMAAEIPKSQVVQDGFELQHYSKGATDADERDMQMLGRTQQLNVRISTDVELLL